MPNPEWTGGDDICDEDDYGNERHLYFHVRRHGGGCDMDDGNECGHDGAAISGMEIEQPAFSTTGAGPGRLLKYRAGEGQDMTHRWHWRKWMPERHDQLCRGVLAVGRMNSALVEFEDGTKVVTNRYAVRKLIHNTRNKADPAKRV